MDNANILLGITIAIPVLTLLVAYLIDSKASSTYLGNRIEARVQCHECLGSKDPT